MSATVHLDGEAWQVRGCLGESWRWFVGPAKPFDAPGWLPASVPGSVVQDLWRAGEVPDPYFERNSLLIEWVPERAWVYRRQLETRALCPGELATLVFEGVDYEATVFVDGEPCGRHAGAMTAFEIDITEALRRAGRHLLAVVVHPAPASEPQVGDSSRVRVHKGRMGYGWDFCPRLVHLGIWRSVRLELGERPWRPAPLVQCDPDLKSGAVLVAGAERLELFLGDELAEQSDGERLAVQGPKLWWPNGEGEPVRYRLRALRGRDEIVLEVGFRHLELAQNPGAPDGARPYTVVVNGRPLFVKGWNWVPLDALYGVARPAKLAHLLALAAEAGVNLLRVWGGGIIETPELYERCDALGLLVWQEFLLSSSGGDNVPSEDPEYLATMGREAAAIVAARRQHPSLAWWCGGNELSRSMPGRDDLPLEESTPVLAVLAEAVAAHSGGRPFLPTSPSGERFLNRGDLVRLDPDGQHDVHGPWEHQGLGEHNRLYDAATCLLHSELGVEAMTNRRSLERLVSPANRWPADRTNPVYEHLGAWWNNASLVERCFGGRLVDLATLRRASQQLQHDGLRYAVEATRRRAPRASGVIPWQLNESYPNAWCTAAVDHRGDPKPAYFGVKRAYRPTHVCAAFPTWAWAGYRRAVAAVAAWGAGGDVEARFVDTSGRLLAGDRFVQSIADDQLPRQLGELSLDLDRLETPLFLLDLAITGGLGANRYLMARGADYSALLDLSPAEVDVQLDDDALSITHRRGPAALGIVIEDDRPFDEPGWLVLGDNLVDLLPGEQRRIPLSWRDTPRHGRRLRLEGWNVAPVELAEASPKRPW